MRKQRQRPRRGRPAQPNEFNPNSVDATIATVIERLNFQDDTRSEQHAENKKVLGEILVQAKLTNGRVTKLELRWRYVIGFAAGASAIAAAIWKIVERFL